MTAGLVFLGAVIYEAVRLANRDSRLPLSACLRHRRREVDGVAEAVDARAASVSPLLQLVDRLWARIGLDLEAPVDVLDRRPIAEPRGCGSGRLRW